MRFSVPTLIYPLKCLQNQWRAMAIIKLWPRTSAQENNSSLEQPTVTIRGLIIIIFSPLQLFNYYSPTFYSLSFSQISNPYRDQLAKMPASKKHFLNLWPQRKVPVFMNLRNSFQVEDECY